MNYSARGLIGKGRDVTLPAMTELATDILMRPFRADDAPWLVQAHRVLYAQAEGFDDSFGDLVARIIVDFLADHDPARERGWVAEREGAPLGSIFCVALDETTANLRLFLLDPAARGMGLGRHMLETCLGFARAAGYARMSLWTHESHRAACALYARAGFACTSSVPVRSFGVDLVEQTWEIAL